MERQRGYLEELQRQTIGSPNMDGMPKGTSQGDVMDRLMIRKQEAEERLQRAIRRLERSKRTAGRILSRLDVGMARFYEAYYVNGEKLEAAAVFAGVSPRTGSNYIKLVSG